MYKFSKIKLLARFLIIFGLGCYVFGVFLVWERNNPNRLAFKSYAGNYKDVAASNPPARIIIRNLNIDLPIYPASVTNKAWQTTTEGASYLLSSPKPGEIGNSIIYGHDWASLFGPLLNARKGERVEIEFEDKTRKIFVIVKTSVVPSNQTSILDETADRRVTLYTCTGFLDSQRYVAVATYWEDNEKLSVAE